MAGVDPGFVPDIDPGIDFSPGFDPGFVPDIDPGIDINPIGEEFFDPRGFDPEGPLGYAPITKIMPKTPENPIGPKDIPRGKNLYLDPWLGVKADLFDKGKSEAKFEAAREAWRAATARGDSQTADQILAETLGPDFNNPNVSAKSAFGWLIEDIWQSGWRPPNAGEVSPLPPDVPFGANSQSGYMLPSYFTKRPSNLPQMSAVAAYAISKLFPSIKAVDVPFRDTYLARGGKNPGERIPTREYMEQPWQSPWEMGAAANKPSLRQYTINPAYQTGTDDKGQPQYGGGEYGQSVWYMPQAASPQQYQELANTGALPFLEAYLKDIGGVNPEAYWNTSKGYWPASSGIRRTPTHRTLPQR